MAHEYCWDFCSSICFRLAATTFLLRRLLYENVAARVPTSFFDFHLLTKLAENYCISGYKLPSNFIFFWVEETLGSGFHISCVKKKTARRRTMNKPSKPEIKFWLNSQKQPDKKLRRKRYKRFICCDWHNSASAVLSIANIYTPQGNSNSHILVTQKSLCCTKWKWLISAHLIKKKRIMHHFALVAGTGFLHFRRISIVHNTELFASLCTKCLCVYRYVLYDIVLRYIFSLLYLFSFYNSRSLL